MPQGRACSDRACKHNRTGTEINSKHLFDVPYVYTHGRTPYVTIPQSNTKAMTIVVD